MNKNDKHYTIKVLLLGITYFILLLVLEPKIRVSTPPDWVNILGNIFKECLNIMLAFIFTEIVRIKKPLIKSIVIIILSYVFSWLADLFLVFNYEFKFFRENFALIIVFAVTAIIIIVNVYIDNLIKAKRETNPIFYNRLEIINSIIGFINILICIVMCVLIFINLFKYHDWSHGGFNFI